MSQLVPGAVLHSYRILDFIGRGGSATVYLAQSLRSDTLVALKVLTPTLDVDVRQRFVSEAKVSSILQHPGIVRVIESGTVESTPFIVMEYVDGGSLADEIRKTGPLSPTHAVEIIQQAASALAYAHSQGVLHGDIKASNILISRSGRVLLSDFGLARAVGTGSLTSGGLVVGTPAYMSPEQVQGRPLDARSDIYSLGVVFYEMLTGNHPFDGQPMEVLRQHVHQAPVSPRVQKVGLSPLLERVVLRMLAKDPCDRYQDAAQLLADLAKSPEGGTFPEHQVSILQPPAEMRPATQEDTPRPQPITSTPTQPMSSARWPWWAAGILLIGVIVVMGLASVQMRSSATPPPRTIAVPVSPSATAIIGRTPTAQSPAPTVVPATPTPIPIAAGRPAVSISQVLLPVLLLLVLGAGLWVMRRRLHSQTTSPPAECGLDDLTEPPAIAQPSMVDAQAKSRDDETKTLMPLSVPTVSESTVVLGGKPHTAAWLLVLNGHLRSRTLQLAGETTTIGRDPSLSDIVLPDPAVSRQHTRIKWDQAAGRFMLFDMGSSNGTLVNGVRVQRQVLEDRDEIRIGGVNLTFVWVSASGDLAPDAQHRLAEFDGLWTELTEAVNHDQYPQV